MAIIFSHDFEDNSLAGYDSITGTTPSIQTTTVYEAARALRVQVSAAETRVYDTFTATATISMRAYIRRASASEESPYLWFLNNAANTAGLFVRYESGVGLRLYYYDGGGQTLIATSSVAFTNGAWTRLEIRANASANPWTVAWRVNGVEQTGGSPATAAITFEQLSFGVFNYAMTWDVYFDSLQVSDQNVYLPPPIFRHTFDDNSLASWDTNDGSVSPTIVTSPVYEGSRALRCQVVGQNARLIKNIPATQTATIRANLMRPSPDLTETLVHLGLHNPAFTRQVYMQFWSSSPLQVRVVGSSDFTDTSLGTPEALALNTWEEIQLGLDSSANPWKIKLWRNGALVLNTTYAQAAFNIERVSIGAWVYSPTYDIYFDDVRVSNEFALISDAVGYRRIIGPTQLASSAATLYTVPTGFRAEIRGVHLNNPSGSEREITLSIGTDAAATRILDQYPVAAGGSFHGRRFTNHTLEAGETIQGFCDAASTVVIEVDANLEQVGV